MFRSRGTRGRGVGLARGRATVNRARGQRGAPRYAKQEAREHSYTKTIPERHATGMRGNRSSEHATAERTNAHNKDSGSSACFQPQPKHMAKEAIRLAFS